MVALLQSVLDTQTGATSITLTLPAKTTPGNTLVVAIATENSVTFATTGATLGGSADNFASILSLLDVSGSVYTAVDIWADSALTVAGTSVVVTANQTVAQMAWVYEFPGLLSTVNPASLVDKSAIIAGASSSWSSGATATTTEPTEVWVGCACIHNSATPNPTPTGPGGPWVNLAAQQAGTLGGAISGYQIVTAEAAATYSGTETGGTLARTVAGVITLFAPPPVAHPNPNQLQAVKRGAYY